MLALTILLAFLALGCIMGFFYGRAARTGQPTKVNPIINRTFPQFVTDEWPAEYCRALATFLKSETGRSLLARSYIVEANLAIRGANDVFNTVHSAGVTKGFSDAIKWIESLASDQTISQSAGEQAETTGYGDQNHADSPEHRRAF